MNNTQSKGTFIGNYYEVNSETRAKLSVLTNRGNFNQVFSKGFENETTLLVESQTMYNTPVEFNGIVQNLNDNKYRMIGSICEFLYVEEDFDTKEEFDDYIAGEPDGLYDVDFEFSPEEIQQMLKNTLGLEGVHENDSPGFIMYGLFLLSKENIG